MSNSNSRSDLCYDPHIFAVPSNDILHDQKLFLLTARSDVIKCHDVGKGGSVCVAQLETGFLLSMACLCVCVCVCVTVLTTSHVLIAAQNADDL